MPRKLTLADVEQAPPGSVALRSRENSCVAGAVREDVAWTALLDDDEWSSVLSRPNSWNDYEVEMLCDALILPDGTVIGRQS